MPDEPAWLHSAVDSLTPNDPHLLLPGLAERALPPGSLAAARRQPPSADLRHLAFGATLTAYNG
jgi:hypothetical protein